MFLAVFGTCINVHVAITNSAVVRRIVVQAKNKIRSRIRSGVRVGDSAIWNLRLFLNDRKP